MELGGGQGGEGAKFSLRFKSTLNATSDDSSRRVLFAIFSVLHERHADFLRRIASQLDCIANCRRYLSTITAFSQKRIYSSAMERSLV